MYNVCVCVCVGGGGGGGGKDSHVDCCRSDPHDGKHQRTPHNTPQVKTHSHHI